MSNMQNAYQRTPARRAEPAEEAPLAKVMSKNDRQREMMRKLKIQQNQKAAVSAKAEADKLEKSINVMEAGPYGNVASEAHTKVTGVIREAQRRGVEETENDAPASSAAAEDADVTYPLSAYAYKTPTETGTFAYAQLTGPPHCLPAGVNPRQREKYLTDQDLCTIFGVSSREAFEALPKWRRDKIKQQKQLFG